MEWNGTNDVLTPFGQIINVKNISACSNIEIRDHRLRVVGGSAGLHVTVALAVGHIVRIMRLVSGLEVFNWLHN